MNRTRWLLIPLFLAGFAGLFVSIYLDIRMNRSTWFPASDPKFSEWHATNMKEQNIEVLRKNFDSLFTNFQESDKSTLRYREATHAGVKALLWTSAFNLFFCTLAFFIQKKT